MNSQSQESSAGPDPQGKPPIYCDMCSNTFDTEVKLNGHKAFCGEKRRKSLKNQFKRKKYYKNPKLEKCDIDSLPDLCLTFGSLKNIVNNIY